jgi:molybdopterin adenylyltransferase
MESSIKAAHKVAIMTLSDKGFIGKREDISGPTIRKIIEAENYLVMKQVLLPDEEERIRNELIYLCDELKVDLILTTGGTGLSSRDCTPEATLSIADKNVPGIAEAIRAFSMKITHRAMLSRGVSVVRGTTLIINLPGSPKAVEEGLTFILSELDHGIKLIKNMASECARK